MFGVRVIGEEKCLISYTWCSILSSQRLVATGIAKMVINGRLTSFWHDKWLFDRPLVSFCQFPIPLHLNSASVRDVWFEGNWRREVFDLLPSNIGNMLSLFTLSADDEDQVIWTASPHGVFS